MSETPPPPSRPPGPPPSAVPPPQPTPATPPPGWYHDGTALRWWDGRAWGPVAPASTGDSNDRTFSILTHGGVVVGGFVLPLVFYLISDDQKRPETRWHSRQALNFQLTYMLVTFGAFIVFFAGLAFAGAFSASGSDTEFGVGIGISFFLFFVVVLGALIANVVFSIIAAVRANAGVRWKYPLTIPFVRG